LPKVFSRFSPTLRLPAVRPTTTISRTRRHLRFAVADSQIRSQDRRFDQRQRPSSARGRKNTSRWSRSRPSTSSRPRNAEQILFEQPDPLYPRNASRWRPCARQSAAASWICHSGRKASAASSLLRPAPQDHAATVHRQLRFHQPSRSRAHRSAHRRTPRRSHRHAALREGEVISSTFDEPGCAPRAGCGNGHREGKPLVEHKRDVVILLDSITRLARAYTIVPLRAKCSRAASTRTHCSAPSASLARPATLKKADRSPSSPQPSSTPFPHGRSHL